VSDQEPIQPQGEPVESSDALHDEAPGIPSPENWPDSPELASAEPNPAEMAQYDAMLARVEKGILIAGAICSVAVLWPWTPFTGWPVAAGLALGTVMAWLNFRWLAQSVNAIGERIVYAGSRERGRAAVVRGIGRIFLIAIVAYGIFSCSVRGLVGFLAGLAMPVLALMCEAAYELFAARRRSS